MNRITLLPSNLSFPVRGRPFSGFSFRIKKGAVCEKNSVAVGKDKHQRARLSTHTKTLSNKV